VFLKVIDSFDAPLNVQT